MTDEKTPYCIKQHYQPVEDKPGYVWLNKRNMQMIKVDALKAAIEKYNVKEININLGEYNEKLS